MKHKKTSIRSEVTEALKAQPNQSLADLAKCVGIPEKKLLRYIKYMERSSEIVCSGGKYTLLEVNRKSTTGVIEIARGGFGFVTSDEKNRFTDDIFIPIHATGGAMSGDTVRVGIARTKSRHKTNKGDNEGVSGRVEEVVKRRSAMIVGLVQEIDGHYYVDPFEDAMHILIPIANPATLGLKEGDVVACKIMDFQTMRVKLHAKLGSMADENIDVLIASVRFGVMMGYSKEMNDEALEIIRKYKDDSSNRRNLSNLFTVTIDGATSKDFDDAVSIDYDRKKGEYNLYVHVADVTHYVRPNSVVDQDALRRGTSVYLPTYTSHMLPEILASDICSLKPGRKRFAMTAHMVFDKHGKRKHGSISQTTITSNKRLTYDYVNQIINDEVVPDDELLLNKISEMYQLSEILRNRRLDEGYIEFKSEEPFFHFDEKWRLLGVTCKQSGKAEKLIEMFMLEANELAASLINEEYGYGVFRIHPDPDPKNIVAFREFCITNNIKLPRIDPENITSKSIQNMVKAVEGQKMESVLTPMLIRSMQKASYDTNSTTHFALSSQEYTHFTSPIRRYPDIIVHRLLKTMEEHRPPAHNHNEITEMLETCNRREDMATAAQRYCETFKKLQFVESQHKGKTYQACVTRVIPIGIIVYIPTIMLRGVVPFDRHPHKHFDTDKTKMMVTIQPDNTKIRIGDTVEVELDRVRFTLLEAEMTLANLNDQTANPFQSMQRDRGQKYTKKRGKYNKNNKQRNNKNNKPEHNKPEHNNPENNKPENNKQSQPIKVNSDGKVMVVSAVATHEPVTMHRRNKRKTKTRK